MSNQVKIFVVAHKPFEMPEGEALVPVHVGRAGYVRRKMAEMRDHSETFKRMSLKVP